MAGIATGYGGQGFSLRGEKDRYVLPPAFRNAIVPDDNAPRTLCLAKHDRWTCLTGFGLPRTANFDSQLEREEERATRLGQEFDRDLRAMQLWGFAEVPFDASGRFVLPDHLADLAGLSDGVYFQGAGEFFTLWAPAELYAMGAGWEGPQAACRKLASDAAAKGKRK
ncbi:MAG: division/cell wall cluster transcriptional repressor MraZ [Croceibacterium sp.]